VTKLDAELHMEICTQQYDIRSYVQQIKGRLPELTKFVHDSQARYHARMESTARNLNRKLRQFAVGDLVKLYKKPKHKKIAKLGRTWQGPYRVIKVTEDGGNVDVKHVAADVVLQNQSIQFIQAYAEAKGKEGQLQDRLQPATSFQRWEVDEIIGDRGEHGVDKEYKVKWKGNYDNTWEPADNLDCPRLVQNYMRSRARKAPVGAHSAAVVSDAGPWSTTIQLDLLDLDPQDMTAEICRRAGITQADVAAQMAPVPCETYSIAGRTNVSRGWHYRDHTQPHKPPRPDGSDKAHVAKQHDLLVSNILTAWKCDADAGFKQLLFMENPAAFLQHRPFMVRAEGMLGLVKSVVNYCAFTHPVKKPTNIWTNARWTPKGNTGDGLCHGKCGFGEISKTTGKFKHFKAVAQEPYRECGVREKNAIPAKLLEELVQSVKSSKRARHKSTIIDLCAGYQSLKPVALQYGFNYIAVDIRGDRSRFRSA